jgi:hypothetical protein
MVWPPLGRLVTNRTACAGADVQRLAPSRRAGAACDPSSVTGSASTATGRRLLRPALSSVASASVGPPSTGRPVWRALRRRSRREWPRGALPALGEAEHVSGSAWGAPCHRPVRRSARLAHPRLVLARGRTRIQLEHERLATDRGGQTNGQPRSPAAGAPRFRLHPCPRLGRHGERRPRRTNVWCDPFWISICQIAAGLCHRSVSEVNPW